MNGRTVGYCFKQGVVTHNLEIVEAMNKRVITMKKGVKVSDSKVVE